MDSELLNIFDDDRVPIGVATRVDVHKYGYWHETFHCWFINRDVNNDYIYFQLRSEHKRDYPNLLDITAAGHLLSNETVEDGIREVKEETGIDVSFHDLIPLGVMDYVVANSKIIDKELAHVYLHEYNGSIDDFLLQEEEVSGIFIAQFYDFFDLWMNKTNQIDIHGFFMDGNGNKIKVKEVAGRAQFVPHDVTFYQLLVNKIKDILENKENLLR
ncbi:MAG: NUDIX domain-containing protein [Candidatus Pristimantibacillus lignocellulolyticus]|uniref:NUDIX domain-containing protein n=1 Tax=Candidatus Pristimantibacillus lignocellulolyticus TaxID=2994561 RepID=A0A9J6ZCB3_9BACL|nr:MAG: NUDIX domain-containing protein [Candidatus Pristimantibacillus lignocellulolyticus]